MHFQKKYEQEYGMLFTEKALEHYLSSKLLHPDKNDVFVDVAAASSPFYDLVEKKYRCRCFAIDLNAPKTGDSRFIQCNATNMPFENASISKMALHCAFEMFENDDDINFIKEANRVLRPGGRIVIIPLYMAHFYHILSSPGSNRKGIDYGKAKRVWWDNNYVVRFARFYSVESFKERILSHKNKLNLKIYYFTNEQQLKKNSDDQIYLKFAACLTKQ
jgi:ubiquinone/menaquinone biosynthesis C-methylase UbiE